MGAEYEDEDPWWSGAGAGATMVFEYAWFGVSAGVTSSGMGYQFRFQQEYQGRPPPRMTDAWDDLARVGDDLGETIRRVAAEHRIDGVVTATHDELVRTSRQLRDDHAFEDTVLNRLRGRHG